MESRVAGEVSSTVVIGSSLSLCPGGGRGGRQGGREGFSRSPAFMQCAMRRDAAAMKI
jgi:hypothetical protein